MTPNGRRYVLLPTASGVNVFCARQLFCADIVPGGAGCLSIMYYLSVLFIINLKSTAKNMNLEALAGRRPVFSYYVQV